MSNLIISIIQTNLSWENKQANLAMLEEKIASIQKTELVILPEMFSTGFSMKPEALAEPMDGPGVSWMRNMAKKYRVILTGSLMINDKGNYYNRLIWMLPDGKCGYYDKRHLFAYAKEHEHYTAGKKRLVASVNGWKINLQVCYDLRFPVWARQNGTGNQAEYDLLIYVANWPERRIQAWRTLLRARAIENQCYVAGVNRVGVDGNGIDHSGDSMIIDPLGEILFHCPGQEAVHTLTISKDHLDSTRERFPFWRDADQFHIETEL